MVISIPAKASVSSGRLSQHILPQPQITRPFMQPLCWRKSQLIAKIVRNKKPGLSCIYCHVLWLRQQDISFHFDEFLSKILLDEVRLLIFTLSISNSSFPERCKKLFSALPSDQRQTWHSS